MKTRLSFSGSFFRFMLAIFAGVLAVQLAAQVARAEDRVDVLIAEAGSADAALLALAEAQDLSVSEKQDLVAKLLSQGANALRDLPGDRSSSLMEVLKIKDSAEFAEILLATVNGTAGSLATNLNFQVVQNLDLISSDLLREAEVAKRAKIVALRKEFASADNRYQSIHQSMESGLVREGHEGNLRRVQLNVWARMERLASEISDLEKNNLPSNQAKEIRKKLESAFRSLDAGVDAAYERYRISMGVEAGSSDQDKNTDFKKAMAKAYLDPEVKNALQKATDQKLALALSAQESSMVAVRTLVMDLDRVSGHSDSGLSLAKQTFEAFAENFEKIKN